MSFECRKCHKSRDCDYHNEPMGGKAWSPDDPRVSYGPCEYCGEVRACVQCGAPRKKAALPVVCEPVVAPWNAEED